ncbi:endonuclease III [Angomonas deanei]|uniref:HhH-GPD superfamily base excision DNA repair protein/Helix-hairpin-helix motif containing protein, putative n=1 Tax=Angomonas deanei TaxID=59799 RepID=A0A7G2CPS2_9TRYP|nr:endonuclease III [Angomonas deanei]CAD2220543.1 HhH-GPD superfamily base excision DNA repair protein/Helix-hairpin-helix motif containing protein, putative [Angomonas deanei]|eukprot:EPY39526.1 endonuclease III [Angomonas deanei]
MLSSQTKDEVTAAAMKGLLAAGLSPQSVKQMPAAQLDAHISKVGFHNKKTEYIKEVSRILLDNYDGQVPTSYADIIALPGVGPKMAHLFLQAADHQVLGIGVDTHVHRISQRFNWVDKGVKTPEDTRKCLESWMPRELWEDVNVLLVGLGQTVCTPVHPKCGQCKLNTVCPNAFKEDKKGKSPRRSPVRDIEDVVEKPRKRARR